MIRPSTTGQVINPIGFDLRRLTAVFQTRAPFNCTATLIGPRVLLTAAHCITRLSGADFQGSALGTVRTNATVVEIRSCKVARSYTGYRADRISGNLDNDFALCELRQDTGVQAAMPIDTAPAGSAISTAILIAGFGCSNSDVDPQTGLLAVRLPGAPAPARLLRVGQNRIDRTNLGGYPQTVGLVGGSGAIVCPGDSGGPVMVDRTQPAGSGTLRLVAINSSLQTETRPQAGVRYAGGWLSTFAPLADPDFATFLAQWVAEAPGRRTVCGLDRPAGSAGCGD